MKTEDLTTKKKIETLLTKMKKMQTKNQFDLSSDEDLSIAVMNLISIEEHMFFTAVKTGGVKYLEVLNQVRQIRKQLMKKMIKDYEGEVWCISKHLLAATMRLNEVGTKSLNNGKNEEAWQLFKTGYQLYSLFWGLNLGVIDNKDIKTDLSKMGFDKNEFIDSEKAIKSGKNSNMLDKLGELVKKVIDCCIE